MALGELAHGESGFSFATYDADKLRKSCEKALADKGRYGLLMAERDGEAVGMLVGQMGEYFFSRDMAATAIVYFVRPENRGGMAAIKLLHGFRRWASARKACQLMINVTSSAQVARTDRLMKRLGFQVTGGNYALRLD